MRRLLCLLVGHRSRWAAGLYRYLTHGDRQRPDTRAKTMALIGYVCARCRGSVWFKGYTDFASFEEGR